MKKKKTGEREMDVARGTVLIVDSDESVRSSISRELAAKGLDCVAAGGPEAVETASTQDFDLLIVGPGRSGPSEIEVIAQIVADHPETGVVMADTGAESQVTAKTTKRSKHTYVPEGVDFDALASRVEKALKKKRPASMSGNGRLREVEEVLRKQAHDLGERVKELNCLYGISDLAGRQDVSLEEILRGTVQLLPPGWQYPEITAGRIVLGDCGFTTGNFEESRWKQQCDIDAHGERVGCIEVYYRKEMPTIDEGPFLKEERKLINAIAERLGKIIERKWAEEALEERSHDLGERVKELNCLYGISSLASRQDVSLDDLLGETVNLMPPSWQYPEATCARIVRGSQEFCSDNFVETRWKQSREILVHGELVGAVEVCYLEEKPGLDEGPFLKEERKLIDAIAERLGRIIERKQTEEELAESRNGLEDLVEERTGELRTANEQLQNTTDELRGVNDRLLSEIVEREQADQRLRELYEEERGLRQQLEVEFNKRVQFARTLAHELKTPLTSVLASSDLLLSQLSEEPLLGLAQNINRSAANLDNRIGELLDLARGEIGTLEMKLESLDILQLLRDAGSEMAAVAASQGQSLVLDLPSSLPLVNADAGRVNQIVANLLTNAFKFTPEGGKIALRSREKGSSVVVEVQDTGPGISKSDQERLFEPYHRLARDRDRLSGLGLGLALAKTLVELHGGEIWVRSHPGQGSTFGFSLPLESVTQQARPSDQDNKLWKVLIIEDDQEIVKSMDLAFQILWPEAELIPARCGEVGIDKVETEDPDLVILDLGLPDISGFDVLRRIRLFSQVPTIVMTVRTGEEDVVKALEWGADDYVTKPFKQKELLARLQAQLRKQPCHDEDMPVVCGTLRFDPSTSQVSYGGRDVSLTIIEGQVLQCLMRNAGNVVAHSRIAEVVWGDEYPGAVESLRTHIWRLREKLESDPGNPQLIRTKAGIGYSLAKPR